RDGAAADIVDAGVVDAFAFDFDEHRRGQLTTIKRTEHHGKVCTLAVPGRFKVRPECDFGGPLGATDLHSPAPACRRLEAHFVEFRLQSLACLFEGEPPVVEHVVAVRHADAARCPVEGGV